MSQFVEYQPKDMADEWLDIVTQLSVAYISKNGHTPSTDEKIKIGEFGDDIIKGYCERVNTQ